MDFVYPPLCAGCGTMTGQPGALCAACWETVRFIERPYCDITGMPFSHDRGEGMVSPEAIANPPLYHRARAAVFHDGVARKIVHGLKYADRSDLCAMMAGWMARAGRDVIDDSDVIVSVPLHRFRLVARRYNQSAELARALSRLTGKPFLAGAMRRHRATRQQVGLGLRARQDNVRGAFSVPPVQAPRLLGMKVLLVDDVFTTGSTVEAATRALLRSGARQVDVLTFARVASQGDETLYA
ncbi:ComF family protein [Hoeflea olei]|uniref:Amidophosphoribosyltransferase n=1 Tax=Hoeflea olei TaxID=1480615 RepID=A0A1C1YXU0_9HYPH|nr:amidophosphoribosyltransferase [Hoeflea olei]